MPSTHEVCSKSPQTRAHQNNAVVLMIRRELGQRRQKKLITGGVTLSRLRHLTTQLHHLQIEKKAFISRSLHHYKSHNQSLEQAAKLKTLQKCQNYVLSYFLHATFQLCEVTLTPVQRLPANTHTQTFINICIRFIKSNFKEKRQMCRRFWKSNVQGQ